MMLRITQFFTQPKLMNGDNVHEKGKLDYEQKVLHSFYQPLDDRFWGHSRSTPTWELPKVSHCLDAHLGSPA